MIPNEDRYQKYVLKFFYIALEHDNNLPLVFLLMCIPLEKVDFEISHFRNFQTSDLDL